MSSTMTPPLALLAFACILLSTAGCRCGISHEIPGAEAGSPVDAAVPGDGPMPSDAFVPRDGWMPPDAFVPGPVQPCGQLGIGAPSAAALSPDETLVALSSPRADLLVDAVTGAARPLAVPPTRTDEGRASGAAFSADGARVWLASATRLREYDVASGSLLRELELAATEIAFARAASRAVAYIEALGRFVVVDLAAWTFSPLPDLGARLPSGFDLSPDATVLVVLGTSGLHVHRLSDGSLIQTIAAETPRRALFSPDGSMLAYTADGFDDVGLARRETSGTYASLSVPFGFGPAPRPLAWSSDGVLHTIDASGELARIGISGTSVGAVGLGRSPMGFGARILVARDGSVYGFGPHAQRHEPDAGAFDRNRRVSWVRAGDMGEAPLRSLAFDASGQLLADGVLWNLSSGLSARVLSPRINASALDRAGTTLVWCNGGPGSVIETPAGAIPFSCNLAYGIAIAADSIVLDDSFGSSSRLMLYDRAGTFVDWDYTPVRTAGPPAILVSSPSGDRTLLGRDDAHAVLYSRDGFLLSGWAGDVPGRMASSSSALFLDDTRVLSAAQGQPYLSIVSLEPGVAPIEVTEVAGPRAVALGVGDEVIALGDDGLWRGRLSPRETIGWYRRLTSDDERHAIAQSPDGTRIAVTQGDRISVLCVDRAP